MAACLDFLVGIGYGVSDLLESPLVEFKALLMAAVKRKTAMDIDSEIRHIHSGQYDREGARKAEARIKQLAEARKKLWSK